MIRSQRCWTSARHTVGRTDAGGVVPGLRCPSSPPPRATPRWPGARPGSKAGHVVINGHADMLPYGAGALDDRSQLSRAAKVVFTTADVTAPPAG